MCRISGVQSLEESLKMEILGRFLLWSIERRNIWELYLLKSKLPSFTTKLQYNTRGTKLRQTLATPKLRSWVF